MRCHAAMIFPPPAVAVRREVGIARGPRAASAIRARAAVHIEQATGEVRRRDLPPQLQKRMRRF